MANVPHTTSSANQQWLNCAVERMTNTYVWHLDLVALLEVLGEALNEFSGGNILDSNSTTGVDSRKLNLNNTQN